MQPKANNAKIDYSFLNSSGEMGQLIRSVDWSANPLGPISTWPQSLQTTLSIILHSKFPMFLFWGEEQICFYNNAYRPSLGNNGKHPLAMGQKGKDCWPEIWEFIKPIIDQVMIGGEASWDEDRLLPIYRNGTIEDVYWTFSYSAVFDESGKPAGVFVTCSETTDKVKTLQTLSDHRDALEFAINAADLGTWDLNPITNKLTVNQRLQYWFGLQNTETDLQTALNIISEKDRDKVIKAIEKSLKFTSGGEFNVEYKIINPITGQERVVCAKGRAFFDDKEMPYRFNGILLDNTEEVTSRSALIESENNFRKLVEQAPIAICVLKEPDYKVTIANNQMLELWGKTPAEVMNTPIFTGLPEAKSQGLEELLLNVFTTGERFVANELPVTLPRNGKLQLTYINFVYEAFVDNGVIEGIMVVAMDVTEQVNARRKIQDAEERVRLAADAVDLGTYDFNIVTRELISSPRVAAIFGFDRKVSREDLISSIHPEDKYLQSRAHRDMLLTGELFYEVRVKWKDGSLHWIRVQGKIYFDNNKNPSRLLGTVLDFTSQRNAKDESMKTKQRLEIALEVGQLGPYELDLATGKIEGSDQFRKNYGLTKSSRLNNEDILKLIVPSHRNKVMEAMNEGIQNSSVVNIEYQVQWPDNTIRWIRSSAKARYDENLKATVFIGVTADITEHKQLQQQKDDFLGIASHELKTPVTTIKAYSQLLEEILLQKGDVKEAGMVTKMGAQVTRLTNLIADLLDVTKINSGKLQLNSVQFHFNTLVNDIVEDIQNTVPKIIIEKDLSDTGYVYADKERIVQVITNLITNAIKYSPNSNKIIVHTYVKNREVILCVQDFGVGISKDHQQKVFEQFYRVSGEMQHTFPGLGLGLYISSEIIKRVGGRIWVTSNKGEGASFCFALPALEQMNEETKTDGAILKQLNND